MSKFAPGDRVQVRPEHDETLMFLGVRTRPGTVEHVHDHGVVIVNLDAEDGTEAGGQAVPYPEAELARARGQVVMMKPDEKNELLRLLRKAQDEALAADDTGDAWALGEAIDVLEAEQ